MKNKLFILLLLVSTLAFGQSVPNTNTFTLDSVSAVVGGNTLRTAFNNAIASYFDTTYVGNKDRLSNFRNYTVTDSTKPSVTTTLITNIGNTTATGGGNVISDGGSAVTARGVCWSTIGVPTLANSHTTDGSGTGTFTSSLTGLTINTIYYVSAYATNSLGTSYGDMWYFTTLTPGGIYQTAVVKGGDIFTSNDYGATWVDGTNGGAGTAADWIGVTVSQTGQYQTAAGAYSSGHIYVSSDYGQTWTKNVSYLADYSHFDKLARGINGNAEIALTVGFLDLDDTWHPPQMLTTSNHWNPFYGEPSNLLSHSPAVAIDSSGHYVTLFDSYAGIVYVSSNGGGTWANQYLGGPVISPSATMNSTGQYQSITASADAIYISSDYGVTWSAKQIGRNWSDISMDRTGQHQVALVYGGYIYISYDYGVTWVDRTTPGVRNWKSVSVGSSGKYMTAVEWGGYIYTSDDYGANWTAQTSAGSRNWVSVSVSR